jgi:formate hydrogenlyase subunit 3/multisubunit Na+/H+ antiporter MnhD subunit
VNVTAALLVLAAGVASWGLVSARHHEPGNGQAGYVYLLMASFGALCLLLAFGLLAGPEGVYASRPLTMEHSRN